MSCPSSPDLIRIGVVGIIDSSSLTVSMRNRNQQGTFSADSWRPSSPPWWIAIPQCFHFNVRVVLRRGAYLRIHPPRWVLAGERA